MLKNLGKLSGRKGQWRDTGEVLEVKETCFRMMIEEKMTVKEQEDSRKLDFCQLS